MPKYKCSEIFSLHDPDILNNKNLRFFFKIMSYKSQVRYFLSVRLLMLRAPFQTNTTIKTVKTYLQNGL